MKTLKRILAVVILLIIIAVIGYLVYTAKHMTTEEIEEVIHEITENS